MTPVRDAFFRKMRRLATVVAGAALLAACSNATSSPSGAAPSSEAAMGPSAAAAGTSIGPSVVPSAAATPLPSAGATPLRIARDSSCEPRGTDSHCVAAGRYTLDEPLAAGTLTIDVPAGWFEWDEGGGSEGLLVSGGTDAPDGSGWGVLFAPIGQVPRDPCDAKKGSLPSTATVDDVVATMAKWPGFEALGAPESITIDRFSGKLIGLAFTKKATTCPTSLIWTTPSGTPIDSYPMIENPSRPAQFRILDVNGQLLGIRTTDYPDPSPFEVEQGVKPDPARHVADQLALRNMVASIQITK